jgi:hypothetical protein
MNFEPPRIAPKTIALLAASPVSAGRRREIGLSSGAESVRQPEMSSSAQRTTDRIGIGPLCPMKLREGWEAHYSAMSRC